MILRLDILAGTFFKKHSTSRWAQQRLACEL
jgi:hypothetical protein